MNAGVTETPRMKGSFISKSMLQLQVLIRTKYNSSSLAFILSFQFVLRGPQGSVLRAFWCPGIPVIDAGC